MIKSYSSSLRARTFLEKVLDEFDASDPEEALHLLRRMKQLLARYHEERTKLRRLGLSDIDEVFDAMLAMKRRAERLQERVDAYRAAQEKLRAIQDALDVDASPEQTVRTIEDISDQLESLYEEREVLSQAGVSDATEAVRLIETMREQLGEVYDQVDGEAPDAAPGSADSGPSDSDPDTVTDMVERIEEQLGVAAVPHSTSENGTGPSSLPTLVRTLERQMLAAQDGEMDQVSFLEQLAAAQVSILVDQEFADTEHPEGVRPLVLEGPEGESLLAVFTAPSRGYPMTEQNPDFAFAVEVSFPWAVHATWSGMGVVVNPGWGVGLTLPPASVEHMKGNATPAS